jgi:hypothetical protein
LIYDNDDLGLPIESMYGDEIAERRASGARLFEVSCLADDAQGKTPIKVVVRLMALIVQCACRRGMSEMLVTVHPHHADFYTGFWGFECIGGVRRCPSVLDNPAVALSLDLISLKQSDSRPHHRAFDPVFPEAWLRRCSMSREIRDFLSYRLEGEAVLARG